MEKNIIHGSVTSSKRSCGKKECTTCNSGVKHDIYFLTRSYKGKVVTKYLPAKYVKIAQEGVENYKRLLRQIEIISDARWKSLTNSVEKEGS